MEPAPVMPEPFVPAPGRLTVVRGLHEVQSMLHAIRPRLPLAIRRLEVDVTPGFPDRTPGNGATGGGKGARVTAPGDDDTQGPDASTIVERLALRRDVVDGDLATLRTLPNVVSAAVDGVLMSAVVHARSSRSRPAATARPDRHVAWSLGMLERILARDHLVAGVRLHAVQYCHGKTRELHDIAVRWGYVPGKPKETAPRDLLAVDLTEEWCTSCLRCGVRWPRWRGELCQWCARFFYTEGFVPPIEIVEVRAAGDKVTEAMVAPHRQRHRDRQRAAGPPLGLTK